MCDVTVISTHSLIPKHPLTATGMRQMQTSFTDSKASFYSGPSWSTRSSVHSSSYGVPFVSKLRFLVMFIKPASFTKPRSIFSKHRSISMEMHRPLLNIDRSLVNIDRSLLEMAIHRPLLNIDRCLAKHRSLLNIDRSLLNIDRCLAKYRSMFSKGRCISIEIDRCLLKIDRGLVKVAGLINITKNRSFDTNGTPYRLLSLALLLVLHSRATISFPDLCHIPSFDQLWYTMQMVVKAW